MKNKYLIGIVLFVTSAVVQVAGAVEVNKPDGSVERAQFTTGIENREPVDLVTVLENDQDEISFFTDIRGMAGRTVTHRWEYQGKVMAEVKFEVGGPRWRVHSTKTLLPDQLGKWTVVVVDQSGWPLHAEMFEYRQAQPEPPAVDVVEPAVTEDAVDAAESMQPAPEEIPEPSDEQEPSAQVPMEVPQSPINLHDETQ